MFLKLYPGEQIYNSGHNICGIFCVLHKIMRHKIHILDNAFTSCKWFELEKKILVDICFILWILKKNNGSILSYICLIWNKIIYILLYFFVHVGVSLAFSAFPLPSPLSPSLYVYSSVSDCLSRLLGGPAHSHVPRLQQQQQHHLLQWKICRGSALQSSR